MTKFSGIPASSKQEMLVFPTKWLESFLPQAYMQASFFGSFHQELADLVFAERRHLVPGGFSTPSVVVYGQKERGSWGFRFFRTTAFENLEISDWALLCSRGKYFRVKMSLV